VRAAILGGTFNPVHIGHLFVAAEVMSILRYEAVIFVPAYMPVHKDPTPLVSPVHRLEMLRIALRGHDRFMLDECEIVRGGPSYSIETVEDLARRHGVDGKPGYIIGDDLAAGFGSWKEPARLAAVADIIVARRNQEAPAGLAFPHRSVANAILPISSSEIRERIGQGRPAEFLVPEGVWRYIQENCLYG
jgi:nicotinate-nucleotide adenylyltransferase